MKTSAISSRYLARDSFDGSLNLTRFPESTNRPAPEHQRLERRSRHVTGMKSHVAKEMARVHAIIDRPDSATRRFSYQLRYQTASFFLPTVRPRFPIYPEVATIYCLFISAIFFVLSCNFLWFYQKRASKVKTNALRVSPLICLTFFHILQRWKILLRKNEFLRNFIEF